MFFLTLATQCTSSDAFNFGIQRLFLTRNAKKFPRSIKRLLLNNFRARAQKEDGAEQETNVPAKAEKIKREQIGEAAKEARPGEEGKEEARGKKRCDLKRKEKGAKERDALS